MAIGTFQITPSTLLHNCLGETASGNMWFSIFHTILYFAVLPVLHYHRYNTSHHHTMVFCSSLGYWHSHYFASLLDHWSTCRFFPFPRLRDSVSPPSPFPPSRFHVWPLVCQRPRSRRACFTARPTRTLTRALAAPCVRYVSAAPLVDAFLFVRDMFFSSPSRIIYERSYQ